METDTVSTYINECVAALENNHEPLDYCNNPTAAAKIIRREEIKINNVRRQDKTVWQAFLHGVITSDENPNKAAMALYVLEFYKPITDSERKKLFKIRVGMLKNVGNN